MIRILIGRILALVIVTILLNACSGPDSFEVNGIIKGNPTMNIRYLYYDGHKLVNGVTASRDGKFSIKAYADQPVVAEIFDNDYHLLGRFYAVNGDKIKCVLDPKNPYLSTFEGNDVSKRLTAFYSKNADALAKHDEASNRIIADYVARNTGDVVSAVLIIGSYNASRDIQGADALLMSLKPEVRSETITAYYEYLLSRVSSPDAQDAVLPMTLRDRTDSLVSYNPRRSAMSLLVISDRNSGRADSIVPVLRELSRTYNDSLLKIVDFSVDPDTVIWKRSTCSDTASWTQAWGAASLAAPAISRLGIPSVPFFIVTDSLGRQLYRGVSLSEARKLIDNK